MANTNLERAASGRPIITSDIPGCKEAVIDGVSGYTCRAKDADDLYLKMKMMAATSREERKKWAWQEENIWRKSSLNIILL